MEKRLAEAALKGNTESLHQILQDDPLILHRLTLSSISQTPLHVASLLGHVDFVNSLLIHTPQLAAELDSAGNSPLHLASAKGHVAIVVKLLVAGPEMTSVSNHDGWTPVHAAVVKGRVEVVKELARIDSTRCLTDRNESVLHLGVKHKRLEVLKELLNEEEMRKEVEELVNLKDCDGNSILHVAVANKQIEVLLS